MILKKTQPKYPVVAFGSRVTGHVKPHSDLDLCIMSDQPLSLTQLAELRKTFSESDLPIRVDIVDWSTLSPQFREIVQKNAVLL